MLMVAICYFTVLGMVWRDYHNSPFFDMCNLKHHSVTTCHFWRVFLVERDYTMVRA
jgi:hypothetical protein